jgi:molybdate transport system substrate-binding protein
MNLRRLRLVITTGTVLIMTAVAGCSSRGDTSPGAGGGSASGSASAAPSATQVSGSITVLAAASLTEAFGSIGRQFEQAHPGATVRFSFGSSATLATQANQGAPADVFAAADQRTMATVSAAGNTAHQPTVFATNTLQIAVPAGNPAKITGLPDLANPKNKVALCARQVPCGAAAQAVFEKAGLTPAPVSYEADVKAALQKVEQNEVDAALVYRTDVISAGDTVQGIEVPDADQVINRYPIAILKQSPNPAGAESFDAFVRSPTGKAALRRAGFGTP